MNFKLLLAPAVALAVAGGWLGSQRHTLAGLEQENATLDSHLAAARAAAVPETGRTPEAGPPKGAAAGSYWRRLAKVHESLRGGANPSKLREQVQFQKAILTMSEAELCAGLDEIAAMDLRPDAKDELAVMLAGQLAKLNPQLVLERFADRVEGDRNALTPTLADALGRWAKTDPAAATAWLDAQLAADKFTSKKLDGRNDGYLQFEGGLMGALIKTDPTAVGRRITELSAESREQLLRTGMLAWGEPLLVANLMRSTLSADQQQNAMAGSVSMKVFQGGYPQVGKLLDKIEANPEERTATVGATVRWLSSPMVSKPIEETRAWIVAQAPQAAERLTGEALGRMADRLDYQEMAAQALQYQAASGSDDALVAFLECPSARTHAAEARPLIDKVSDPAKREQLLQQLPAAP